METAVNCERCGRLCQPGVSETPTARPFRKAQKGMCPDCVTASFLQQGPLAAVVAGSVAMHGPQMFLLEHIQRQFAAVLQAGGSEMLAEEVNWQAVVDNWHLPF